MKKMIIALLWLACHSTFGQGFEVGDTMYVIAQGGLTMRLEPGVDGEKITLLPKGSAAIIAEMPEGALSRLPDNGYSGYWVKVSVDDKQGYVFSAYLSKLRPIVFSDIDENGCWKNDIVAEMAEVIGKVDSIEYNRYGDGEGTYRMIMYTLKNGGKYIMHFYWEHYENEIQLVGLREEEIDQFVRSILAFCPQKMRSPVLVGEHKRHYTDIRINGDCCLPELRIIILDDQLVIRTQVDPGS